MKTLNRKTVFGWCMYDWANSAFATTIMAGFFPLFFKSFWCAGTDPTVSTARLGLANSLSGIGVALAAPVLGAIADKGSAKKKLLIFFAYMGVVMTSALFLVSGGRWIMAIFLYIFAAIGFSGANIFYDALITLVAPRKKMDFISALGYSLGYLGGGMLFALNVWMYNHHETFGFAAKTDAVRFAFLTVGLWWALFTIPLILFVKEPKSEAAAKGFHAVRAGLLQLKNTFQEMRRLKTILLFLAAYWLYMDGVDTIVRMALAYGMSIGFETKDLIAALLIVQFVGFPSAIGFGFLGQKIGTRRGIFLAIVIYLFISIWGAFIQHRAEFYILAVMIGLVQGGIQALSRSFYAKIIPPDKSAEFFGFYNMLGKFAVVIGPVLMGGTGLMFRSFGFNSQTASRISITSIALLFLLGGLLFYFVDEKEGQKETRYLSSDDAQAD